MKLCGKCNESKPLTEFGKGGRRSDNGVRGPHSYCRQCMTEYQREWRRKNPAAMRAYKRKWEAAHPEEVREAKRRRYRINQERMRERARRDRKENPEKYAAYNAAAREKARAEGLDAYYCYGLTPAMRAEILAEQDGRCALCQRSFTEVKQHIDHDHDTEKIRGVLCAKCNPALGWLEGVTVERVIAYLDPARHRDRAYERKPRNLAA